MGNVGRMQAQRWVLGDIHGHFDKAVRLLSEVSLIDDTRDWSGGDSELYVIGDLTDRGPQGLASIDLIRKLQSQAGEQGGGVVCLMGNHELFLLGAKLFPDRELGPSDYTFDQLWRANGGVTEDLEGLTDAHIEWLTGLPSVIRAGDYLLIHADSQMYTQLGGSAEEANATVTRVLGSDSPTDWDVLITSFVRRNELWDEDDLGEDAIRMLLKTFGGETIVHGHTPIPLVTRQPPATVTKPLVYSGGRCINVDGGMFLGGPGFTYRLDQSGQ